jgi:soluble lytic murein transglycosylase-like protein
VIYAQLEVSLLVVTLLIYYQLMKNAFHLFSIKTFIAVSVITSPIAQAEVYVDLSQADEVSIINTQNVNNYTFKIDEPSLPSASTNAVVHKHFKTGAFENLTLPFNSEVIIAANQTDVEPALIHAVIAVESRHNPRAQSKKGAFGLMQLMPETSRRFKVLDKYDPKQNILAGAQYLRELINLFNGDISLSLAAYNAGPAAVQKYGRKIPPYKETMEYVPKVMKYYKQYS